MSHVSYSFVKTSILNIVYYSSFRMIDLGCGGHWDFVEVKLSDFTQCLMWSTDKFWPISMEMFNTLIVSKIDFITLITEERTESSQSIPFPYWLFMYGFEFGTSIYTSVLHFDSIAYFLWSSFLSPFSPISAFAEVDEHKKECKPQHGMWKYIYI